MTNALNEHRLVVSIGDDVFTITCPECEVSSAELPNGTSLVEVVQIAMSMVHT